MTGRVTPTTPDVPGGYPAQMRATRHVIGALGLAVLLATITACGAPSGPSPVSSQTAPAASAVATPASPSDEATAPPSEPVPATSEPATTAPDASAPAEASGEPSDEPSEGPGLAAACSGSDDNRDFFADAAAALDWTVYCGVLPAGWFVQTGEYRLRDGGTLTITYKGPGGATFMLQEGALCAGSDGCAFHGDGTPAGDAPFGDRTGSLFGLSDGGWALAVDAGAPIGWLATGEGIDEATFRSMTADLAAVGD